MATTPKKTDDAPDPPAAAAATHMGRKPGSIPNSAYAQTSGPNAPTPAEVRADLRKD